MSVLSALSHAYSHGDHEALRELYSPESEVVVFGPGVGEKWIGRTAIDHAYRREFKNFPETDLEFTWVSIGGGALVAWVAAECKTHVKIDNKVLLLDGRFSAVLEHRAERWLIVQSHFSFPCAL